MLAFPGTTRWLLTGLATVTLACAMLASVPPERAAAVTDCSLTAPASITASNNPNQAGAVVNYSAPTTSGSCATVTCSPASGAFYQLGTTLVTCTASTTPVVRDRFTIRVLDTQPPAITVPPNKTVSNDAGKASAVVTFASPTASDNAPDVTVACDHLSGSLFPLGTTPVTCTARDTSGNTATASFNVIVNDTEPPVIQAAFFSNPTFAVKRRRARAAAAPRGSRLSFVLTKAARVTIAIDRCKARRRATRGCARARRVGTLVKDAGFGLTSMAFSGALNGKALAPGAYRAVLNARDSGQRSSAGRTIVSFRIVRR